MSGGTRRGRDGSTSNRCVAIIRGINVGRAKRIAMADLRALVEGLGYGEARTLLNSGNVVFASGGDRPDRCASRIEGGLSETLGVTARVTVLTSDDLETVVEENALVEIAESHSRLFVVFPRSVGALALDDRVERGEATAADLPVIAGLIR